MAPPGPRWGAEGQPAAHPRHEVDLQRPQPLCGGSAELAGWVPWSAALSFPPWAGLVTGEAGPGLSAGGEGRSETPAPSSRRLIISLPGPRAALSRPCAALRPPLTPLPSPSELEGTSVTTRVTPHCVEGEPEACPPPGAEDWPKVTQPLRAGPPSPVPGLGPGLFSPPSPAA